MLRGAVPKAALPVAAAAGLADLGPEGHAKCGFGLGVGAWVPWVSWVLQAFFRESGICFQELPGFVLQVKFSRAPFPWEGIAMGGGNC